MGPFRRGICGISGFDKRTNCSSPRAADRPHDVRLPGRPAPLHRRRRRFAGPGARGRSSPPPAITASRSRHGASASTPCALTVPTWMTTAKRSAASWIGEREAEYVIRRNPDAGRSGILRRPPGGRPGRGPIVSHVLTYAARLVAEKKGIPWACSFLQPLGFFSAYDPPVLPQIPFLSKLRFLGPAFHRPLFRLQSRAAALGLSHGTACGQRSHCRPRRKIRCSRACIHRRWCWRCSHSISPANSRTGRCKRSSAASRSQTRAIGPGCRPSWCDFWTRGPPPIVFTLGSSAIADPGPFFEHSAAAAKLLGRRAVLIVGNNTEHRPASLPAGVVACAYAPFAELFPRAAAIVHAGGIGTTALAMRSGRPMLVMPCAHDQFDNAARVTRLGIARTISRRRYSPTRIAAELRQLLDDTKILAARIGDRRAGTARGRSPGRM